MWTLMLGLALGGDYRVVEADVLNVRSEPVADAPITARVRINWQVEVLETRGRWSRVRLANEPPGVERIGWVATEFLGESSKEEALWRRAESSTGEERLTWARRALAAAYEPSRERQLRLATWLDEAGHTEDAEQVRAGAEGRLPTWIATCHGGRALLAGRVEPDGSTSVASVGEGGIALEQARALGLELAGVPWDLLDTQLIDERSRRRVATPFSAPFVDDLWNQEPVFVPKPEVGSEAVLVLGACGREGALYFSQPVATIRGRPATVSHTARFLAERAASGQDHALYGASLRYPFPDETILEVALDRPHEWRKDEGRDRATTLQWVGAGGQVVAEIGEAPGDLDPESAGEPVWLRLGNGRIFGVVPVEWSVGGGLGLVGRTDDGWSIGTVRLHAEGC